uniref:LIM zinc-binding domain-containing protein n=1 Tax=Meloidogyne incognita TaxID=6306 RepID=A0A914MZ45_MELIC
MRLEKSTDVGRGKFEDEVKPALELLLNDLQRTTEILRKGHLRKAGDDNDFETVDNTERLLKEASSGKSKSPYAHRNVGEVSPLLSDGFNSAEFSTTTPLKAQRDPMLDGDKLGIHTIPKGDCPQCGEAVIGPVVIALGRMWHPEHFCCAQCGDPIGHRNFFERQGKAYCENDFHDMFSPRCHYCNGSIKERCVTALGKNISCRSFVCAECGHPFLDGGFHERHAPKCQGCKQPITNKFINALNTQWHPECFCCQADKYFGERCPMAVDIYDEIDLDDDETFNRTRD